MLDSIRKEAQNKARVDREHIISKVLHFLSNSSSVVTMMLLKLVLVVALGGALGGEPKCLSRFDYDEKMLMKLLRLEDIVTKFDARVTYVVDSYAGSEVKLNHALETVVANFSDSMDRRTADYEARSASLSTSLAEAVNATLLKGAADIRELINRVDVDSKEVVQRAKEAVMRIDGVNAKLPTGRYIYMYVRIDCIM